MISIIVNNYNRSYLLPLIMKAYTYQATPVPAEMIIVDDESDPQDHYWEYVKMGIDMIRPHFKVRAFRAYNTNRNSSTLNIGVKNSVGDVLVLNYSDVVPVSPGILEKIASKHKEIPNLYLTPKVVCTHPEFPILGKYTPLGSSISRELFYKVGGFDERFKGYGPVDVDFSYRLIHGMKDLGCQWAEAQDIAYMHIEQAKIPIRDDYRNKDENIKILIENEKNFVRVVNPSGWGICPKLEEMNLDPKLEELNLE